MLSAGSLTLTLCDAGCFRALVLLMLLLLLLLVLVLIAAADGLGAKYRKSPHLAASGQQPRARLDWRWQGRGSFWV